MEYFIPSFIVGCVSAYVYRRELLRCTIRRIVENRSFQEKIVKPRLDEAFKLLTTHANPGLKRISRRIGSIDYNYCGSVYTQLVPFQETPIRDDRQIFISKDGKTIEIPRPDLVEYPNIRVCDMDIDSISIYDLLNDSLEFIYGDDTRTLNEILKQESPLS